MASPFLTQILFWMCVVIFVRLFTYQRGPARFRRGVSCVATMVMGSAGWLMIYILKGELVLPTQAWPLLVLVGVFVGSLVRAEGNMAGVLRPEPAAAWIGPDRRRKESP